MIDFTSLLVAAGLFVSLVVGNAALFGDPLRVQIIVPQSLETAGFTQGAAEQIFTAEAARMVRGESVVKVPTLQVTASPSLINAVAKPLNLDGIVTALQSQFGINHLYVAGAILETSSDTTQPANTQSTTSTHSMTAGKPLDMVMMVVRPHLPTVGVRLTQEDGDAVLLVQRGAQWAMERVSPYRVALAHLISGIRGNPQGFDLAKTAAIEGLEQVWYPGGATERALLHNVIAIVALAAGDEKAAQIQYAIAEKTPDVSAETIGALTLNQALLAVAAKDPARAAALFKKGKELTQKITVPGFQTNVAVLESDVVWAGGDRDRAERILRDTIHADPYSAPAHYYLAKLLAAKGDPDSAEEEVRAANFSKRFDEVLAGAAVVLFWANPVDGGLVRFR